MTKEMAIEQAVEFTEYLKYRGLMVDEPLKGDDIIQWEVYTNDRKLLFLVTAIREAGYNPLDKWIVTMGSFGYDSSFARIKLERI